MKRVIFDTDIGIDDAMALLFLHYAETIQLEAITTVSGNASIEHTTRNALYMCQRFNIDAPVFRGTSGPIGPALGSGYPDFVHGKNGLGDIPLPNNLIDQSDSGSPSAAEAIIKLARENPGEITVIAVGRLSNIALALESCPELPKLLKELIVMGGVFMTGDHRGNVSPVAEANMGGDPLAADRVLGSGIHCTMVGLDVTHDTLMDESFINELHQSAGDAGQLIFDITRYYFNFYEGISGLRQCPIHDASAVAYFLAPHLYHTRSGPVRVATEGVAMGQTILGEAPERYAIDAWTKRPSVHVCTDVDGAGVRELYLKTLALAGQ